MTAATPLDPRHAQLRTWYDQLTARIEAADRDIGWALTQHDRMIHKERRDVLAADRELAAAYLDALERGEPLPGAWPPEFKTTDLLAASPTRILFKSGRCDFYRHIPLPTNYIPRPELLAEVRERLLAGAGSLALTSAIQVRQADVLHGMGGIGKSVLARALCDDPDIQAAFPDGILWATLGQTPDLTARLREWIETLGGIVSQTAPTLDQLKNTLAEALKDKACLLIVDDAWRKAHLEPFCAGGPRCRLLITTRDAALAEGLDAGVYPVPVMASDQAAALLEEWAGREVEAEVKAKIVKRLGCLPLAVRLAGAQLREKDPVEWLASFDARELKTRRVELVHDSLEATFALSLDTLSPANRRLYVALAIFDEDEPTPVTAVAKLWSVLEGCNVGETNQLLRDLASQALIARGYRDGETITVHDLLRDLMAAELGEREAVEIHRALIAAYQLTLQKGWETLADDGYLYRHLVYHLIQAEDDHLLVEYFSTASNAQRIAGKETLVRMLRDAQPIDSNHFANSKTKKARKAMNALKKSNHSDVQRVALQAAYEVGDETSWEVFNKLAETGDDFIRLLLAHYVELMWLRDKSTTKHIEDLVYSQLRTRRLIRTRGKSLILALDITVRLASATDTPELRKTLFKVWGTWLDKRRVRLLSVLAGGLSRAHSIVGFLDELVRRWLSREFPGQKFADMFVFEEDDRLRVSRMVCFLDPMSYQLTESNYRDLQVMLCSRRLIPHYVAKMIISLQGHNHFERVEPVCRSVFFSENLLSRRHADLPWMDELYDRTSYAWKEFSCERQVVSVLPHLLRLGGGTLATQEFIEEMSEWIQPVTLSLAFKLALSYAQQGDLPKLDYLVSLLDAAVSDGRWRAVTIALERLEWFGYFWPNLAISMLIKSNVWTSKEDQVILKLGHLVAAWRTLHPEQMSAAIQTLEEEARLNPSVLTLAKKLQSDPNTLLKEYVRMSHTSLLTGGMLRSHALRALAIEAIKLFTEVDSPHQYVKRLARMLLESTPKLDELLGAHGAAD